MLNHVCYLAAPEKNPPRFGKKSKAIPLVTQGIDIWSLGCVFSVAATYVVAGKEGVKQYRLLRQRAISKLNLGIGDPFHDTKNVLPEVIEWHRYLRTGVRAQDTYTSKVLDVVDQHMLITPGNSRISGQDLYYDKLRNIKVEAERQNEGQPPPPGQILEFLDDVMNGEEQGQLALEDIPRTISQSGAAMFKEALLYRSLRSDGLSHTTHSQYVNKREPSREPQRDRSQATRNFLRNAGGRRFSCIITHLR